MRAVVQRVTSASVQISGEPIAAIGPGLCVLLGIQKEDTAEQAIVLAKRIAFLRVFNNNEGRLEKSVLDVCGSVLVVSQFTLAANTEKGNRPSFSEAADQNAARTLYDLFVIELERFELNVQTGHFGSDMLVEIMNDGPVTLVVDQTIPQAGF